MALSIVDLAACAGHHQRLEARLAELVGEWARTDPDATAAALFARHCSQIAWHAELWGDRLPSQPSTSLAELTAATPTGDRCRFDESLIHSVDTLAAAATTIERLVGIYQLVLPRLLGTCEALSARIDQRVDAPTARVLELVTRDLRVACAEGGELLARRRV